MTVSTNTQNFLATNGYGNQIGQVGVDLVVVADPRPIRELVASIERFLGLEPVIRLSLLTGEEWFETLNTLLTPAMRRGAERHLHLLRDPVEPTRLLVSPSAVTGVNEGSRSIITEVVYNVLRAIPSPLPLLLRRGLDETMATAIGERLGVALFTRTFPDESGLVNSLLEVLALQYGHSQLEWTLLFRRKPERIWLALSRSRFASYWLKLAREDDELQLPAEAKKDTLVQMLQSETLATSDRVFSFTASALDAYLQEERSATKKKAKKPAEKPLQQESKKKR